VVRARGARPPLFSRSQFHAGDEERAEASQTALASGSYCSAGLGLAASRSGRVSTHLRATQSRSSGSRSRRFACSFHVGCGCELAASPSDACDLGLCTTFWSSTCGPLLPQANSSANTANGTSRASQGLRGLDRPNREIDGGYSCVVTCHTNIVLISQSDFSGAGCSKHRRDDLARNGFIRSPHTHHCYEVHSELKVSHGNPNTQWRALFPLGLVCIRRLPT
jgi:hypothetical protein